MEILALYLLFCGTLANIAALGYIGGRLLGIFAAPEAAENEKRGEVPEPPRNAEKTAETIRETPAGFIYSISGPGEAENWQKIKYLGEREERRGAAENDNFL